MPQNARRLLEFDPTHKILLATNHLPNVRGTDNGIWRRVKLIPFKASFDGKGQDTKLREKLDSEISGILNWMIDGYAMYIFEGMAEPAVVSSARSQYQEEMNPVQQFVEDECTRDDSASKIRADKLYQAFKFYCEQYGILSPARANSHSI